MQIAATTRAVAVKKLIDCQKYLQTLTMNNWIIHPKLPLISTITITSSFWKQMWNCGNIPYKGEVRLNLIHVCQTIKSYSLNYLTKKEQQFKYQFGRKWNTKTVMKICEILKLKILINYIQKQITNKISMKWPGS